LPRRRLPHTYSSELSPRTRSTERVRLSPRGALVASLPVFLGNYWLAIANVSDSVRRRRPTFWVRLPGQISLGQGASSPSALSQPPCRQGRNSRCRIAMIGASFSPPSRGPVRPTGIASQGPLPGTWARSPASRPHQPLCSGGVLLYGDGRRFGLHVDRNHDFGWRPPRADLQSPGTGSARFSHLCCRHGPNLFSSLTWAASFMRSVTT